MFSASLEGKPKNPLVVICFRDNSSNCDCETCGLWTWVVRSVPSMKRGGVYIVRGYRCNEGNKIFCVLNQRDFLLNIRFPHKISQTNRRKEISINMSISQNIREGGNQLFRLLPIRQKSTITINNRRVLVPLRRTKGRSQRKENQSVFKQVGLP